MLQVFSIQVDPAKLRIEVPCHIDIDSLMRLGRQKPIDGIYLFFGEIFFEWNSCVQISRWDDYAIHYGPLHVGLSMPNLNE